MPAPQAIGGRFVEAGHEVLLTAGGAHFEALSAAHGDPEEPITRTPVLLFRPKVPRISSSLAASSTSTLTTSVPVIRLLHFVCGSVGEGPGKSEPRQRSVVESSDRTDSVAGQRDDEQAEGVRDMSERISQVHAECGLAVRPSWDEPVAAALAEGDGRKEASR